MHMIYRLLIALVVTLALLVGVDQPVYARPVDTANGCGGIILSGLWQGANLTVNSASLCAASADTTKNTLPGGQYIALGDSVAAGQGLVPADGSDPVCDVSAGAYPSAVAASVGLPYSNFACSGATAGDLVSEQHLDNTGRDIEPQLDRAFADGTPRLITITAGANDLYWQYFVRQCYTDSCGSDADKAVIASLRSVLKLKLKYALQEIRSRSGGNPPRVVLTGYYQPLSSRCTSQISSLTRSEVNWFNQQISKLNSTIRSTTSGYSFARYASVSFSGHELCTTDPWVQGIDSPAPLHPTEAGQQAIAASVLKLVR